MSMDTVDDLHAAEDFASSAVACIEELLDEQAMVDAFAEHMDETTGVVVMLTPNDCARIALQAIGVAVERGRALVSEWEHYCRPTCRFLEEGECIDGDSCGCPCQHEPVEESTTSFGWSELCEDDPDEPGRCAYHRAECTSAGPGRPW